MIWTVERREIKREGRAMPETEWRIYDEAGRVVARCIGVGMLATHFAFALMSRRGNSAALDAISEVCRQFRDCSWASAIAPIMEVIDLARREEVERVEKLRSLIIADLRCADRV